MLESSVGSAQTIEQARERLIAHGVYERLNGIDEIRVFMKYHVFAVWDFFSLLKRLQREVTTVTVPWLPAPDAAHGRFINEIVVAEETDEDGHGGYISHFELYRRAMDEIGADPGPIDAYVGAVRAGTDPLEALEAPEVPAAARRFVSHTLKLALHGPPHEVAASFCHGRENLLPDVLGQVVAGAGDSLAEMGTLRHYLERHIELDHDEHGPLALRLLASLCDGDPEREQQAERAGVDAIEARIALWDGVLAELDGR